MILLIDKVEEVSKNSISNLEQSFKSVESVESKYEIFTLNMALGWMFLLKENKIERVGKASEYISSRIRNVRHDMEIKTSNYIPPEEFFKLRFFSTMEDVKGMQRSNYPETKMYLPYKTYNFIYREPLALDPDLSPYDASNFETFDQKLVDEVIDFTNPLINHMNWIIDEFYDSIIEANI
ncbi:MAG: hypothetical protein JJU13_08360 [Balneolaceae bacterium]|nr:hypothetical protein [Balneolaceae bacterium]